jgi:hypothetical protein
LSTTPSLKLSFGETLSESFGFFFRHLRLFFHLVTIPWIISIVLRIVGSLIDDESPVIVLIEKAVDIVPTTMFVVAWMRVVLLGPQSVGRLPGLGWSQRETTFVVSLLKVAGITFFLLAAFVMALGTLDPISMRDAAANPELARRQAMALPFGTSFVVSAFLALRVSYGLAASAVDLPLTPRQSWVFSRGSGWAIIGVLFLIFFTSALAITTSAMIVFGIMRGLGASQGAVILAWTVAIFISYGGVAIAATAQALIFRKLTGWQPGLSPVS